jgi:hypothetical protein
MFLSGGLDDKRNCEVGVIGFPNGKPWGVKRLKGCMRSHSGKSMPD